jgi:L-threonylcarbamoyladenylate synthase
MSGARILRVNPAAPDPATLAVAGEALRNGALVAFPTETVYGLGAHALDDRAVRRIFAAKGRPAYNPLIIHVPDTGAAREVAADWPELAARAAEAFWPGPLTLVLPRTRAVPASVTAGLDTVAVRVPSHPVALGLLRAAAVPVAAPSANRFTRVSPTTAAHVVRGLGDRIDIVLDGGATPYGIESTVLDVTGRQAALLRHGAIGVHELEPVLGPVLDRVRAAPAARASRSGKAAWADRAAVAARPSPGMLDRHYAPDAELVVYPDATTARTAAAQAMRRAGGARIGAVVLNPLEGVEPDETVALPADARGYARLFYAALHTLEEAGCTLILVEQVPAGAEWESVRDRLRRSAAGGAQD